MPAFIMRAYRIDSDEKVWDVADVPLGSVLAISTFEVPSHLDGDAARAYAQGIVDKKRAERVKRWGE